MDSYYRENILDHYKNPRNFGVIESPDGQAQRNNPLCGDQIGITFKLDKKKTVKDVKFSGAGCSINVPDTGKQYEVRCFPWNAEYGLVDSTLPVYVSGHHAPVLDCRMKIASGNGDANFECKEWKEHHSLYEDAK